MSQKHTEGWKPETEEALPNVEKDAGLMPGRGVTSTVETGMAPTVQKYMTWSVAMETTLDGTRDVPMVALEVPVSAAEDGVEVVEAGTARMDVPDESEGLRDVGANVDRDKSPGGGGLKVSVVKCCG